jgi:hypothetical protein
MTTFLKLPRLLKGGIGLIDPTVSAVRHIIGLQGKYWKTIKGK